MVYTLGSGDRTSHKREHSENGESETRYYSLYTAYVTQVRRLSSKLTYTYENDPSTGVHASIFPPRFIGTYGKNRPVIRGKKRLKRITASNAQGNDNRSVAIDYYPASSGYAGGACPNKIKKISSLHATNTSMEYAYEHNTNGHGDFDVDQCLLSVVKQADGSQWKFAYGIESQSTHQFVPASDAVLDNNGFYNQVYFPLRSVTIPTGAKVAYDYVTLNTCEYQDVYQNNTSSGVGKHKACSDVGGGHAARL